MRIFIYTIVICFFLYLAACKPKVVNVECNTFTELSDPTSDTLSDWSSVLDKGLLSSFVSIDAKYAKSILPQVDNSYKHKITGWKGEKLSAQILLWSAENINNVTFEVEDILSGANKIDAKSVQVRFVRYVMTDEFASGCGTRNPEDFKAALAPDMLDNVECLSIDAKTVRPVWITVDIPQMVEAAIYTTKIKILADGKHMQTFDLLVDVLNKTLPTASEWKYHLDLWQHPSAVARVHNLELWSEAHFEKMRPLMKLLANAGQKVITANINKDPWNHQCYDAYQDMIIWTKNVDGTWFYDYTIFDKWIRFMMSIGIDKMINCYSMIPWNNELHYIDGSSKQVINIKADPGTIEFEEMWGAFLPDFSRHLKEQGWLNITNIAMDERSPDSMKATLDVVQKYAPELGIALADNHQSYKRYPFIKDMCVALQNALEVDEKDILERRDKGLITTFYTYCRNEFANQFTFSDSAESTFVGWFAAASGFDGSLRWAYNSWVEDPILDSRFRTWPAGDTYIVYPDARSSIRFERLIEGIQDYEKISILRKHLAEKGASDKLDELNNTIAKLKIGTRTSSWNEDLNVAKVILNELSR